MNKRTPRYARFYTLVAAISVFGASVSAHASMIGFTHTAFGYAVNTLAAISAPPAETGAQTVAAESEDSEDGTLEVAQNTNSGSSDPASTGRASATAELDTIVDRVQTYYDSVEDFVADFEQRYTSAAMGEMRSSTGRVFFKKPGKMRWDYAAPTERYLISDGAQLWIYEPEYGQYFTESLTESQLPAALRFLMGEGDLRENFNISLDSVDDSTATLALEPKVSNSQYARLQFVVEKASGAVKETLIFDAIGNQNRLIFNGTRRNQGLPDAGFNFDPPEGAVQVEAP